MLNRGTPDNWLAVIYIYIVARAHPWLYQHLVERFADDPDVRVILDRRMGERRNLAATRIFPNERRNSERRRSIPVADDLDTRSHYIVEV